MKKLLTLFAIAPVIFLLTGCPYNSKVPLSSKPAVEIDKALLGTWVTEENDSSVCKVFEFNKTEYYIDIKDITNGKTEVTRYRAFISSVGGEKLVNIENLKYKGDYNFFRYRIEGNELIIETVSDVVMKGEFNDSKKLAAAFTKNIKSKDFFEKEIRFQRKTK